MVIRDIENDEKLLFQEDIEMQCHTHNDVCIGENTCSIKSSSNISVT